jgi:Glutathione S-transferase, N-terminal domain
MARITKTPSQKRAIGGKAHRASKSVEPAHRASKNKPIDLYYWPTPNGWKITTMLEECSLPYTVIPVDISKGDQFKPQFLAISPNNRMPAIVDHDGPDGRGGEPLPTLCAREAAVRHRALQQRDEPSLRRHEHAA